MRCRLVECVASAALLCVAACHPGWSGDAGPQTLWRAAAPGEGASSLRVSFDIPDGWSWYERGSDLIATRDGVFLENILVERIHVDQTHQSISGFFTLAAPSAKQWPLRTVKHLQSRFRRGMSPFEAAAVIVESRAHDPAVADLEAGEISSFTMAGTPAFEVVLDFELIPRGARDLEWPFYGWSEYNVQGHETPYRSIYCGFVLDDWFYGVTYTAARRHYFDRDLATFEAFLRTVQLRDRGSPPGHRSERQVR
jgi:hypothetical protein